MGRPPGPPPQGPPGPPPGGNPGNPGNPGPPPGGNPGNPGNPGPPPPPPGLPPPNQNNPNNRPPYYDERVKPIKPEPYDGSPDLDNFTRYVHEVIDYIKAGRVQDDRQVIVAGRFLTGKAQRYYLHEVSATAAYWTIHQFFYGLFNDSFQQDFRTVLRHQINIMHQGDWKVRRYATTLLSRFALLPDETERTRVLKLWDGLKLRFRTKLLEKGYSPEISSWDTIVDQAEKIQSACKSCIYIFA